MMENSNDYTLQETISSPRLITVEEVLPKLNVPDEPSYAEIDTQEQERLFKTLVDVYRQAENTECTIGTETGQSTLEQANTTAGRESQRVAALKEIVHLLDKLWQSRSTYFQQAAEILANGSRDPSWRIPYGKAGILAFFLDVVSAPKRSNVATMLHSLRLVGNSCADTDCNREIVVKGNHTLAIIHQILDPAAVQIAIPVLYNVCMDYEPAQSQAAVNQIVYILLKLIRDGMIDGALLEYSYEIIELASEQNIDRSPDETVLLLNNLALAETTSFLHFACLVNCLATYLRNERFQDLCIEQRAVDDVLSVLQHSYKIEGPRNSSEEEQLLAQLRLKINQALSDLSARPQFPSAYPLRSPLTDRLKSWLELPQDQLQICSCVMLGNLARSDEVCQTMVNGEEIHKLLINLLKVEARGSVLHSVLGFLKNLAIAGENRCKLGEAGIIPAASHLLSYDTIPQVQFLAVSLIRQVIASSVENISRLLSHPSDESGPETARQTYLSALLALCEKTDTAPIKTETGRTIASVCRTIFPLAKGGDGLSEKLRDDLFLLHDRVYGPIASMITQTEWPVVRSEGWFTLALMASTPPGSAAVAECLRDEKLFQILEDTLTKDVSGEEAKESERVQRAKDRDNAMVMLKELLGHSPRNLPETTRVSLESLITVSSAVRERSSE